MKSVWATTSISAIAMACELRCSGMAAGTAGFPAPIRSGCIRPLISNPVFGYQAINVEAQKRSPHSLLYWMKRLIEVRKSSRVFSRGSMEFLQPSNHRVLAYIRQLGSEIVLAVNNLSSSAQAVELDLRNHKGSILVELASRNLFPRIGDAPYLLTLGPYQIVLVPLAPDLTPLWRLSEFAAAARMPVSSICCWLPRY